MNKITSHLLAFISVFVWGTSYLASKYLLELTSPTKLAFFRFVIGYLCLLALNHKFIKHEIKDEVVFMLIGVVGCGMYYYFENNALLYTYTSNVSIIVAAAPLVTALLAYLLKIEEKINKRMIRGFILAFVGVIIVILNGKLNLKLNPFGDFLAILAVLCWGFYSIFLTKVMGKYDDLYISRKVIFYGLISMLPLALTDNSGINVSELLNIRSILALLYLGIIASGIAYVFWNKANNELGIVLASKYVYLSPVITMIAGYLFLNEKITWISLAGTAMILLGLYFSDSGD